jgi:hypothetical protein
MNMRPIVPPTPKALELKKRLMIVLIVHLILAIMLMICNIFSGLSELINVMVLFCAFSQMHFCYLIFYMVLCIYAWVNVFSNIGFAIQVKAMSEIYSDGMAGF